MGLDLLPLAKPLDGHEAEHRALVLALTGRETPKRGFLASLFTNADRENAQRTTRLHEISQPHYETLDAPIVGRDAEASDWVRQRFEEGALPDCADTASAMAAFDGYRALEAMPACDGLPLYSNEGQYERVDRASFRGAFLQDCGEVLGPEIIEQAWTTMLADELANWSKAVAASCRDYAESDDLRRVIGERDIEDEFGTPARNLHIADSAARWAAFWSSRGHGSEAYF